jgi:AcrR family transcriptional regulator
VTNKLKSRGRRSDAQAARTRAKILRSAESLFARRGYQGVSMRDLATACGVRMFTIQHHYGTKLRLYQEILRRWERQIQELLEQALAEAIPSDELVGELLSRLFTFYLANRERVALSARANLGEGLPKRAGGGEQSWVSFMSTVMKGRKLARTEVDPRLLLITVEGILNNHTLAVGHYQHLFGRDVTDAALRRRVEAHLKRVVLSILGGKP